MGVKNFWKQQLHLEYPAFLPPALLPAVSSPNLHLLSLTGEPAKRLQIGSICSLPNLYLYQAK